LKPKGKDAQRRVLHRAYLLRCWREAATLRWRFSAEEVLTKQPRRGFDALESLFNYLRAEMAGDEDGADAPSGRPTPGGAP
jgi:hypothetical protein